MGILNGFNGALWSETDKDKQNARLLCGVPFKRSSCYNNVQSQSLLFLSGGSPYPRMDGSKIANLLQEGYRMPKPQHVDDEL